MPNTLYLAVDDSLGARGIYSSWTGARAALIDWLRQPIMGTQETDWPEEDRAEYDALLTWLEGCETYQEFNDDERNCRLYEIVMATIWAVPLDAEMEN